MTAEIVQTSVSLLTQIATEALEKKAPPPLRAEALPFPKPAGVVEPSDKVTDALVKLGALTTLVQVTERRAMTPDEQKDLMDEDMALREVSGYIDKRKGAIGMIVRHHADCQAEQAGAVVARAATGPEGEVIVPASERTKDGNYQLARPKDPYRMSVPGTGKAWSLEYSSGKVEVHVERLLELMEAGKITREEFLRLTRQVRIPSDTRIIEFMRADPERGTEIMQMITDQGPSSASLFLRNG